jgi:hypothetical protein
LFREALAAACRVTVARFEKPDVNSQRNDARFAHESIPSRFSTRELGPEVNVSVALEVFAPEILAVNGDRCDEWNVQMGCISGLEVFHPGFHPFEYPNVLLQEPGIGLNDNDIRPNELEHGKQPPETV